VNLAADSGFGTLGVALTVLFGAIGVIGAIATSVTIARSKTLEQNLELLRGAVADLTTENARVTAERDTCRQQLEELPNAAEIVAEIREMARQRGYTFPPDELR
jgi:hypothetical protein